MSLTRIESLEGQELIDYLKEQLELAQKYSWLPPTLLCDFYKIAHRLLYPEGTEVIYSTLTPRSNKYFPVADKVVAFGFQGMIKKYLIEFFNIHFFNRPKDVVVAEYKRVVTYTLNEESSDSTHIEELHDLGYLPIKIQALPEGTLVPIKVPVLTIENTDKRFFWLTNYLETLISTEVWKPMTSATIAYEYRKLLDEYALKTTGSTEGVAFQGHDFSMRGMSSLDTAMTSGAGHLLSFVGTDTIPSILYHEKYYNANIEKELVGTSISATEHSIMSAYTSADGNRDEYDAYKNIITKVHPNGFVSIVSDTYDFWKVVSETIPSLKEEIMNRDGRVVIRPDSGNPVSIICGEHFTDLTNNKWVKSLEDAKDTFYEMLMDDLRENTPHGEYGDTEVEGRFKYDGKYYELEIEVEYNRYDKQYYFIEDHKEIRFEEFTPSASQLGLIECLWNTFGGTVTEQGYKVLDGHIGAIYGDSITLERAKAICQRLMNKGFASTNIVFGIGSYTYQMNTRDTLGFAMKATYAEINGKSKLLLKDPKTDDGIKKSLRGKVLVTNGDNGELTVIDGYIGHSLEEQEDLSQNLLQTVFEDGELLIDQSLSEIRTRLLG